MTSLVDAMGAVGARLSTGFDSFDASLRGGFPGARTIVIGGAPGAAKTMLVSQWALTWARAGNPVVFLASDEEAEGILTRWGQALGFALDKLEAGDPATKRRLGEELGRLPLRLIDSEHFDDPVTIDQVSNALASHPCAAGKVRVLIVDSAQTAKAQDSDDANGPRERIDAAIRAVKRAARGRSHLSVVTSELARGSYRSTDRAEQTSDLAAFKESGTIEYQASVAIVLRSVDSMPGTVDVTIPKNRVGRGKDAKRPFRMSLDFATATLTEIPMPVADRTDDAGRSEALETAIFELIDSEVGAYSANGIAEAFKGKGVASRQKILDAVRHLTAEEAIGQDKKTKRYFVNRYPDPNPTY